MIIFELSGGLGNQMFQVAVAHSYQLRFPNIEIVIDVSQFNNNIRKLELDKFFYIKENFLFINQPILSDNLIIRNFSNLLGNKIFIESNPFIFDEKLFKCKDGKKIRGYFQSEKYFSGIRDEIIKIFKFPILALASIAENIKAIQECNSVSLHVRRGDYISNKSANAYHGVLSLDYYKQAAAKINYIVQEPHYFIFSDDTNWVKSNLNFVPSATFVDINKGDNSYLDMYLMSQCKHNIIANSSFSWWGAWLNQNEEKIVIAPQKWLANNELNQQPQDLIPEKWITL